ncbi:MAG TPA: DUF4350 domain-containing protein [Steroidobacteraceae bacterium]
MSPASAGWYRGHACSSRLYALFIGAFISIGSAIASAQMVVIDAGFATTVDKPTYTTSHPKVVIDAFHHNYHKADGFYAPLAALLQSDGYVVQAGNAAFSSEALSGISVLVIANALPSKDNGTQPVFAENEIRAVRDWVRAGGALLLIADHAPFGTASKSMAGAFGVVMGEGYVFDLKNSWRNPTFLVFDRDNGLLGKHPILEGNNSAQRISRIVAFTGQSLSVPTGASVLLRLGKSAYEAASSMDLAQALTALEKGTANDPSFVAHAHPVRGPAQAVALPYGMGRVVVAGEAAMFTAQILRLAQNGRTQEMRFGMNVPGNDDKQFALNVLHWLSRASR